MPDGWNTVPAQQAFSMDATGETHIIHFKIIPPAGNTSGYIKPVARINGVDYSDEIQTLSYPHIPEQRVLFSSGIKVLKPDFAKKGKSVAYIKGAGDAVADGLEVMGYSVTYLKPDEISAKELGKYDALVFGIRAFNTVENLDFRLNEVFEYVKNGGTVLVQYNTSNNLKVTDIAPYPIKLSRNRVTDEEAEISFLDPSHPAVNKPNKITSQDFEGWVQERGLYFASEWDPAFKPVFSCSDKGEKALEGGLLIGQIGKGYYIYTSLSWFRQLPEGVPGAYRILANLISIGK
jgi:hypothetical protein